MTERPPKSSPQEAQEADATRAESQQTLADLIAQLEAEEKKSREAPPPFKNPEGLPKLSSMYEGEIFSAVEEKAFRLADKAGLMPERSAMIALEHDYLEARRAKKPDRTRAKELETAYDKVSADYEKKLEERLVGKLAAKDLTEERATEVARRYRRLIISRDIIDRSEKLLAEALSQKEKGLVMKSVTALALWDKRQLDKLGEPMARAVRIFRSAFIGAGIASVAGAGIAAFGATALGYRLARTLAGTAVGGAAGTMAGDIYAERFAPEAKRRLQEARERSASGVKGIAAKRKAYRKGSAEAIAKKQRMIERVTAAFVGFGVSLETAHEIAKLDVVQDAAAAVPEASPAAEVSPPVAPVPTEEQLAAAWEEQFPEKPFPGVDMAIAEGLALPEAPLETAVSEIPARAPVSVTIDERGEGASKLFKHLQQSLREQGYTAENASSEDVRYILAHTPDQSSIKYGFLTAEGSRVMHMSDTFTIDEHGDFSSQIASEHFMPDRVSASVQPPESVPNPVLEEAPSAEVSSAEVPPLEDRGFVEVHPATPLAEYGSSSETFTNAHGVVIDPTEPALFADRNGVMTVHGGGFDLRAELAKRYLDAHPGAAVRIEVDASRHPFFGEYRVGPNNMQSILPFEEPKGFLERLFYTPPKLETSTFIKRIP